MFISFISSFFMDNQLLLPLINGLFPNFISVEYQSEKLINVIVQVFHFP